MSTKSIYKVLVKYYNGFISTQFRILWRGEFLMNRSEIIKRLISESGLSMRAFSEKVGIPNTTLHSMLERGIGNASVDNVIKVCKGLGITVEELENMASESLDKEKNNLDNDIFTKAAHKVGHEGPLTDEEKEDIALAIKIALARRKGSI